MSNILKFSEFINEDFKHFEWTNEDETQFNKISSNDKKWTFFSWAVVKPVNQNGVPDILVDISGEIYDNLADVASKYAHRGYGKAVLSETYARNVTINVRPAKETRYSNTNKEKLTNLSKQKYLEKINAKFTELMKMEKSHTSDICGNDGR